MDSSAPLDTRSVLAELTCTWSASETAGEIAAAVIHSSRGLLLLEATDPRAELPAQGTRLTMRGEGESIISGTLAEHGRGGRFLVTVGDRAVRHSLRLKVSLPATLRPIGSTTAKEVEIVDLTARGARIRGIELPVGSQVMLSFTPPYRGQPVNVRAAVAHGTHGAERPWIGVVFRLVALRGGR